MRGIRIMRHEIVLCRLGKLAETDEDRDGARVGRVLIDALHEMSECDVRTAVQCEQTVIVRQHPRAVRDNLRAMPCQSRCLSICMTPP